MVVQRCKGSRDLVPAEMARFRAIEDKFRDIAGKSGYREVRTPTLEYLHLFTSIGTLTPGMLKRVYSFLDWDGWSGERVVMRPDVTIPVARLYIENLAKERLARLYYVSNVFRFEGTGRKTRERWQCGLELVGVSSSVADAELIRLALTVLAELGLSDITVRLSHGGLICSLLAGFGLSREEQTEIFDRIADGDTAGLKKLKGLSPEMSKALGGLLELNGQSSGFLKNFKAVFAPQVPSLAEPLDDFIGTVDLLEALGAQCIIDITTGRGFEYYTGIIYQLFSGKTVVGGGGRYDDLIPLVGGAKTPASGLALNIFNIMDLLPEMTAAGDRVLVKAEPEAVALAFGVITSLQQTGYNAEMYLGAENMGAYSQVLLVKAGGGFVLTDTSRGGAAELPNLKAVTDALGKAA